MIGNLRTKPSYVKDKLGYWVIAPTKFPEFTNQSLKEMGYDIIIWANQTERTKIRAVRSMLGYLKKNDRMLEAEYGLCATLEDMKGLTNEV